ncbi:MAG TPA: hypothetical protein VMV15_12950 [Candidatus Binataceae bacterium]|nr:hypothetical protein [Candidatus Binataceae bacterium]
MNRVRVSIAISDYDHVRDLADGIVQPEGIELVRLNFTVEEIFWRFSRSREWDVSEMSFANYVALITRGDDTITAIPVFPSRVFRTSAFYLRADGGIRTPDELGGKRVGVPEWIETAGVYARGYLAHHCGVPLSAIEWYQGGLREPGRTEKMKYEAPRGVKVTHLERQTLEAMLEAGELDAILTATQPSIYRADNPSIVRFANHRALEEDYFRATGVLPAMHLVAIKREVLRQNPWIAMNLYQAFEEAKRRSIHRMFEITASRVPIVWHFVAAEESKKFFPGEYWPYGIEPNRKTLEAFLQYAYEQGVAARLLQPEELFAREVQSVFKI